MEKEEVKFDGNSQLSCCLFPLPCRFLLPLLFSPSSLFLRQLASSSQGSPPIVMGLFDLERHFAFYEAYHCDPINVFIHILFVWPILFMELLLFYFTPPILNLDIPFNGILVFNFGFLLFLAYAAFYVIMDKKAGSLAAFLCFLCWVGSSFLGHRLGYSLAWKVVLAAQLFCWTFQFIGHRVFEKRVPALLDSLAQAFLMAPLFVLLDVLHKLLGYEPYQGFNSKVKEMVRVDREKWQASKRKKVS